MAGLSAGDVSYTEERGRRLLYRDEGLHLEVLQLVFTLVFNDAGQLDATYCDQFPWERKLQVRGRRRKRQGRCMRMFQSCGRF
jgi:hypothetical protein